MKSILLIGLGRFGRHLAENFQKLHHEVLAIDCDERRADDAMQFVTNVQIGDSTNEHFIASLGVRNFDLCVVAIGDDFQSSLETTALLKENGAPFVLARAAREVHAKFLLNNGADEIIYPEKQTESWAAVRYSVDHIFDYIELEQGYAVYEIAMPDTWVGKTLSELAVRRRYRFNILAVKDEQKMHPLPEPDRRFRKNETLLILGEDKDIMKFLHA
mgnify:CR=1 FL=1